MRSFCSLFFLFFSRVPIGTKIGMDQLITSLGKNEPKGEDMSVLGRLVIRIR